MEGESNNHKMESINTGVPNKDAWAFYESIGRPKFVVAPMVDQSELAYRLLTRRYNAQLCYTPMFHSRLFSESQKYREQMFTTCPEDRPLIVQFCGNDPDTMLEAAKLVEDHCDAVDINLGCPQGIAKKGKYGAFLLEKEELVCKIVEKLASNLKIPVTCKVRLLKTEEATLRLVKNIEKAGCKLLTVHGRTKEEKKQLIGNTNWAMIRKIKEALNIPVFANGSIASYEDVLKCLEETKCDGVMSSECILEYPALYSGKLYDMDDLTIEYLELCEKYETDLKIIRAHTHKFLYKGLQEHHDIRTKLTECHSLEDIKNVALEMKKRRIDVSKDQKLGWYFRYWKHSNPDSSLKENIDEHPKKNKEPIEEADVLDGCLTLFDNEYQSS